MSEQTIRHVTVTGRVQGVGYRVWTVDEARSRGLSGWVRNLRDGSVEAVFSGPADLVDRMIARCRVGPSMARVADLAIREATSDELALRGAEPFAALPTH